MRIVKITFGNRQIEIKNTSDATSALHEWFCMEEGNADSCEYEAITIKSEFFEWTIHRTHEYFVFCETSERSGSYEANELIGEDLALLIADKSPAGIEVFWGQISNDGCGFVSDMKEENQP